MGIMDLFRQIETPQPTGTPELLLVGLGNPGSEYRETRHNAGFMALDTLAQQQHTDITRTKFKAHVGDVTLAGRRCLLMKPDTYMNNSGEAVSEAMRFYKIPPENIIVVLDDITLAPGKLRIRRKGSAGGHNGLKSIIYHTGSDAFARIRLGIGAKPNPDYDLADWVLSRFTPEEIPAMHTACEQACICLELMAAGKTDEAMNKYNA